jgi:hypothetical protein
MPGSPIRRARRGGIRLADGTVIAFPKLTHPRAGLSHDDTIDFAAACGRARQREEPRDFDEFARRPAERDGAGRPADA